MEQRTLSIHKMRQDISKDKSKKKKITGNVYVQSKISLHMRKASNSVGLLSLQEVEGTYTNQIIKHLVPTITATGITCSRQSVQEQRSYQKNWGLPGEQEGVEAVVLMDG